MCKKWASCISSSPSHRYAVAFLAQPFTIDRFFEGSLRDLSFEDKFLFSKLHIFKLFMVKLDSCRAPALFEGDHADIADGWIKRFVEVNEEGVGTHL